MNVRRLLAEVRGLSGGAGKEGLVFEGEALCFDCEEDTMVGQDPKFRGKVVVIR